MREAQAPSSSTATGTPHEWHAEAEKRGLLNLKTTVRRAGCAVPTTKNVEVFEQTSTMLTRARAGEPPRDLYVEQYVMTLNIEAATTENDGSGRLVLPSGDPATSRDLASTAGLGAIDGYGPRLRR